MTKYNLILILFLSTIALAKDLSEIRRDPKAAIESFLSQQKIMQFPDFEKSLSTTPFVGSSKADIVEVAGAIQALPVEVPESCWLKKNENLTKELKIELIGENHQCPNCKVEAETYSEKFRTGQALVFAEGAIFEMKRVYKFDTVDRKMLKDHFDDGLGIESPSLRLAMSADELLRKLKTRKKDSSDSVEETFIYSLFGYHPKLMTLLVQKAMEFDSIAENDSFWNSYLALIGKRWENVANFSIDNNKELFVQFMNLNRSLPFESQAIIASSWFLSIQSMLPQLVSNEYNEVPQPLLESIVNLGMKNAVYGGDIAATFPQSITLRNYAWTRNIIEVLCDGNHDNLKSVFITAGVAHSYGLRDRFNRAIPKAQFVIQDNYSRFKVLNKDERLKHIEEVLKTIPAKK